MVEVIPRLWLSGCSLPYTNYGTELKKLNIATVLNMSEFRDPRHEISGIEYCNKFAVYDTTDTVLPLKETSQWLHEKHALSEKNVLVHCVAGRNRSVATIIGYLINEYHMSYEQSVKCVGKEPENSGFVNQLKLIEFSQ